MNKPEATKAIKKKTPRSSASEVLTAIKGINFPANRDALVSRAKENEANPDVVKTLESLAPQQYNAVNDISKALSTQRKGEQNRSGTTLAERNAERTTA